MNLLEIRASKQYILLPDSVWDGTAGRPARDMAVYICDGRINNIVSAASISPSLIDRAETVEMPGITLMPGLVDCHIHFAMNCADLFKAIRDWTQKPTLVAAKAHRAAGDYLANGVLAVRDGSDRMNIGLKTRDAINQGKFPGPLVTATGLAIYKEGCYGEFLGPGAGSRAQALQQVKELYESGALQVKVIVSGLVSFKTYGRVGPVQFEAADLNCIVNEAHGMGLKVMAHASSAAAVEIAVQAGIDSVEHGYFIETRQLQMMAARGTAWVPTLAPTGNLISANCPPYAGADLEVIRRTFKRHLEMVREGFSLGVTIGVGTDAGANHVNHGTSYHDELHYLEMAGLDKLSILQAATGASAGIISQSHRAGTVTAGREPRLIGVAGNPMDSLEVLRSPAWIIIPANRG